MTELRKLWLSIICFATTASAQSTVDTVPDRARIRLTMPAKNDLRWIATVDSLRKDSLYFSMRSPIAYNQISRLELSAGRLSHTRAAVTDAGRGALVGLSAGAFLVIVTVINQDGESCDDCFVSPTGLAVAGAVVTTTLGAVTGAIVGLIRRPERWVRVRLRP